MSSESLNQEEYIVDLEEELERLENELREWENLYAEKDPLVEYQLRRAHLFSDFLQKKGILMDVCYECLEEFRAFDRRNTCSEGCNRIFHTTCLDKHVTMCHRQAVMEKVGGVVFR